MLFSALEAGMKEKKGYLHFVCAGSESAVGPISVDEVILFRAGDACTSVVTGRGEYRIHTPLAELQPMLDPSKFRQAQTSTVVNVACIESIVQDRNDALLLKLKQRGETVPVSNPFREFFSQLFARQ